MHYELINVFTGSGRWDEKKDGGWKERMEDWKMQQGNLAAEFDDSIDPDMAMYVYLKHVTKMQSSIR